jgi:hypothetical protein
MHAKLLVELAGLSDALDCDSEVIDLKHASLRDC